MICSELQAVFASRLFPGLCGGWAYTIRTQQLIPLLSPRVRKRDQVKCLRRINEKSGHPLRHDKTSWKQNVIVGSMVRVHGLLLVYSLSKQVALISSINKRFAHACRPRTGPRQASARDTQRRPYQKSESHNHFCTGLALGDSQASFKSGYGHLRYFCGRQPNLELPGSIQQTRTRHLVGS
jgi:hypothetical protein